MLQLSLIVYFHGDYGMFTMCLNEFIYMSYHLCVILEYYGGK